MIFTAAMNFKAEGGGVPMAPAASACDGKLSFCEAAGIPKWRTFLCLPFLVAASIHLSMDFCDGCQRLYDPFKPSDGCPCRRGVLWGSDGSSFPLSAGKTLRVKIMKLRTLPS